MTPRLIVPFLMLLSAMAAFGQEPSNDVTYSRHGVFRIPFQTESGAVRIKQVQLYVSTDQGQAWHPVVTATPSQRYFDFRAQHDGLYWFAVRTVDMEGHAYPLTMDAARPALKVHVDTQVPLVRLRQLPSRGGELGVEWEVQDENLDSASLRLDSRIPGGDWLTLGSDVPTSGQRYWKPATNGSIEVRLRARDRADNWNEDKLTLSADGSAGRSLPPTNESPAAHSNDANMRLVNSKHISLNYEIKDKGPSGISTVELWFTQDRAGRNWQKYREEDGATAQPPFVIDVNGEGIYGFSLIVRSGVGLGDRPPQVGDQPQVWVEVDLTKPVVHINKIDVGRGTEAGRLTINWTATDKNIAPQPISFSYAKESAGPWTPIATNLDNSGRYVWQMPADVPFRFWVKAEAADRAGNIGADVSASPVVVDLAQPKAVIVTVEPASK